MRWVWLSLTFALIWLVGYLQLTIWVILVLHPLLLWVIARHMKASHSPLPKPAPIKPLLPTESCHWLNNLIKQWLVSSQLLHIMHTMYPEVFRGARGNLPSRKYFSCPPELILNDKWGPFDLLLYIKVQLGVYGEHGQVSWLLRCHSNVIVWVII